MATANRAWNLESFLDSLIIELDKARETLAVKAINKPLTYAVKDLDLELQLFPQFDGNQVKFITAQPGQAGASKVAIQLGSITDQQIRKTTKEPLKKDDVSIEIIDDLDEDSKNSLRKIGVSSINDLEQIEKKNVDLEKITDKRGTYKNLADILKKARRGNLPPTMRKASLSFFAGEPTLNIEGDNLVVNKGFEPVAVFNNQLAEIMTHGQSEVVVKVQPETIKEGDNELVIVLDPYAIFKVNIKNPAVK